MTKYILNIKQELAKRKITGHFHNMVSCAKNGNQTVFCIKCNVWDTEWPLVKVKEERVCLHFDEVCCSNVNCPQKLAHDEYMKFKNQLLEYSKQKGSQNELG